MNIQADVKELHSITEELKRLSKITSDLRKKKANIERRINEFLVEKNLPGVKYKGVAIISKPIDKHIYKPPKLKIEDVKLILSKNGIKNADIVVEDVLSAMRGKKETVTKIKIAKMKK